MKERSIRKKLAGALAGLGLAAAALAGQQPAQAATIPTFDHVIVVVMENHGYPQVIGSSSAPYINSLANNGAKFTQFYGLTHPSQPNYFMLFSGGNQGNTTDTCPSTSYSTHNIAEEIIATGRTWGSYNEGLPSQGSTVCTNSSTKYARKHNPWFSFSNVPASTGYTFTQFPSDYTTLPTLSFVVPNLCNDMHDCSVATGDTWIQSKLGAYATWATTHNSLLVVTFDEDNGSYSNRIPVVFYGAHVATGSYSTTYNHYNLLRTLEDMYGTSTHAGNAASAAAITSVWN